VGKPEGRPRLRWVYKILSCLTTLHGLKIWASRTRQNILIILEIREFTLANYLTLSASIYRFPNIRFAYGRQLPSSRQQHTDTAINFPEQIFILNIFQISAHKLECHYKYTNLLYHTHYSTTNTHIRNNK
jgi:hypothetical protein